MYIYETLITVKPYSTQINYNKITFTLMVQSTSNHFHQIMPCEFVTQYSQLITMNPTHTRITTVYKYRCTLNRSVSQLLELIINQTTKYYWGLWFFTDNIKHLYSEDNVTIFYKSSIFIGWLKMHIYWFLYYAN